MAEQAQVEHSEAQEEVELPVEDRILKLFEPKGNEKPEVESETKTADEPESKDQPDEAKVEKEAPLPEAVEVEFEGKSYKVAPELKDALLRQSDYTKKTQDVAEVRRTADALLQHANQVLELQKAQGKEIGQITALDEQIAQYEKVDWNQLTASDATRAQQLFIAFQQAKDSRQKLVEKLGQLQSQQLNALQEARRVRLEEGQRALGRDIKGWNPEMGTKILRFAQETYGAPPEQLAQITEPWAVRALNDAMLWRTLQASKPGLEKRAPAEQKTLKPKASDQRTPGQQETDQFRRAVRSEKTDTGKAKLIEQRIAARFK